MDKRRRRTSSAHQQRRIVLVLDGACTDAIRRVPRLRSIGPGLDAPSLALHTQALITGTNPAFQAKPKLFFGKSRRFVTPQKPGTMPAHLRTATNRRHEASRHRRPRVFHCHHEQVPFTQPHETPCGAVHSHVVTPPFPTPSHNSPPHPPVAQSASVVHASLELRIHAPDAGVRVIIGLFAAVTQSCNSCVARQPH